MKHRSRKHRRRREAGSTSVEYLLIISVAVVGILSAAYAFVPQLAAGVKTLGEDVNEALSEHELNIGAPAPNPGRGLPPGPALNHAAPDYNPRSNYYRNQLRNGDNMMRDPIRMEFERTSGPTVPGVTAGANPLI